MKEMLSPTSVAIIGASNDETKLGGMLVKNMINAGFKGRLYPVNPKGGEIQGLKAYTSVTEIGEPVATTPKVKRLLWAIKPLKNFELYPDCEKQNRATILCRPYRQL